MDVDVVVCLQSLNLGSYIIIAVISSCSHDVLVWCLHSCESMWHSVFRSECSLHPASSFESGPNRFLLISEAPKVLPFLTCTFFSPGLGVITVWSRFIGGARGFIACATTPTKHRHFPHRVQNLSPSTCWSISLFFSLSLNAKVYINCFFSITQNARSGTLTAHRPDKRREVTPMSISNQQPSSMIPSGKAITSYYCVKHLTTSENLQVTMLETRTDLFKDM